MNPESVMRLWKDAVVGSAAPPSDAEIVEFARKLADGLRAEYIAFFDSLEPGKEQLLFERKAVTGAIKAFGLMKRDRGEI